MILCAHSTSGSREHETQITQREHAKGLFILQPKYQDCMIIEHGSLICFRIDELRKGLWAFFLDRAFRVLIGWVGKLRSRGYK